MIRINENYLKLQASYLFAETARRVAAHQKENPKKNIIKMGIGDVTRALPAVCIQAFHEAVDEMARDDTFRGYGPEQGYLFLREAIAKEDFQKYDLEIQADEIFVSDGAKCDTGNIQEIFAQDISVAIPDPVYPAYIDTNVMAGRTGDFHQGRYAGITYLEGTRENGFIPSLPPAPVDLIYLCYPNNPTGAVISKDQLRQWVDYASEHQALILFDAAYEAFIRDDTLPRSIFEIEGARKVAIEFRSLSKTAGFTGTRCAYTVVPKTCMAYTKNGESCSLNHLWNRRHTTKFNSVSYPVQRAAAAVYSPEGRRQTRERIDYYLRNAAVIVREVTAMGLTCIGGINSPYIWVDCQQDSWAFFDLLLNQAGVVCTPGAGFGRSGQGFIRLSAFNDYETVITAMDRMKAILD